VHTVHRFEALFATLARELGDLPGAEPWRGEVLRRAAELQRALRGGDDGRALAAATSLVGLGEGSTPAGDDYLIGALHALALDGGAVGANDHVAALREVLPAVAMTRTTSPSAAWLAAAARGESSTVWSALLQALAAGDEKAVAAAARTVRATGHTSGAFSLRGFLDTVAP
jgi:uncharacterized protein DUF2877